MLVFCEIVCAQQKINVTLQYQDSFWLVQYR
jgi:hypothetical protein